MHQRAALLPLVAMLAFHAPAAGQSAPTDYRDEFLRHFDQSSQKIMSLAAVVPQSLYEWSPGEGVMTIAQVYMHIARYNFMYLDEQLGFDPPSDIDVPNLESITDKDVVTAIVRRSVEHVRNSVAHMDQAALTVSTRLYGRDVAGWAVLFQLLAHLNEHVGQSVAYVRMNGIVPPWST